MVFWGQIQNYMMRSTLSLLIVAMVRDNTSQVVDNSTELTCLSASLENDTTVGSAGDLTDNALDWDGSEIGQVMGAFNIGYICTQVGQACRVLDGGLTSTYPDRGRETGRVFWFQEAVRVGPPTDQPPLLPQSPRGEAECVGLHGAQSSPGTLRGRHLPLPARHDGQVDTSEGEELLHCQELLWLRVWTDHLLPSLWAHH